MFSPNSCVCHVHQVKEAIRGILDLVHPVSESTATVTASGTYNATLVSYPLQVDGITTTHNNISVLEEVLLHSISLTLGGLNAILSPARSIAILDFG